MKILDFQNLDTTQTIHLNKIAMEQRIQYTKYIDKLSLGKEKNFAWWVTGFATRNTDYFPEQLYKFLLAKDFINNNEGCKKILVDELGLYRSLHRYIKANGYNKNVEIVLKLNTIKSSIPFRLIVFLYKWFGAVKKFFIVQTRNHKSLEDGSTIDLLIDTYVLASCFDSEGKYTDRYFNGILNYLSGKTMFAAVLLANTKSPFKEFLDKLENEQHYQFLIREKFLTFFDYIRILWFPLYCIGLLMKEYDYHGDSISSIVRRGIIRDIASDNTFDGYIAYSFLKGIKRRRINIKDTILWYEGQPSTMGFVIGMKKFYPEVPCKGFLELTPMENQLSFFPSEEQYHQKKVPSTLGVMGKALRDDVKIFCKELKVEVYPAFRYYSGNPRLTRTKHEGKNILVLLPYSKVVSKALLEDISKAFLMVKDGMLYRVFIKNHPNNSQLTVKDYHCNFAIEANWIDGQVTDILDNMDLAINAFSSSGMEIIAKGVFLINYIPCGTLSNTGIPSAIPKNLYQIAYTADDIYKGLRCLDVLPQSVNQIAVEEYFEPVTRETVQRMLG